MFESKIKRDSWDFDFSLLSSLSQPARNVAFAHLLKETVGVSAKQTQSSPVQTRGHPSGFSSHLSSSDVPTMSPHFAGSNFSVSE